ncbi:MAG TPA: hypothetical protein VGX25_08125 [Actinophytocola sp.]|uniref:hypothetical protein n=1 Tax=Actinophytocola sp. TaxID=1872138 RepID=UPI002DDD4458|nr:hypothetical protein [Actinophytocola sp.]HEV2779355.1 hypothetical protein [Actinophytocola sp.]
MAERADVRAMAVGLAKALVTTALAGPVAGVGVAADTAINAITARLAKGRGSVYDQAVKRITTGVEAWADGERLGGDDLRAGLSGAAEILASYGLNLRGIARLGMDAERVAAAVLDAARPRLRQLGEAEEAVCRRVVTDAYRILVADAALLPGLELAFRQEVLERLDAAPAETAALAAGRGADVLSLVTSTWTPVLHPPSALLRAAYRVVPFNGRDTELAELERWRDAPDPLRVRLVSGPGGMGKTRLLIEAALRASAAGWRSGFLVSDVDGRDAWAADLLRWRGDLFVVIDYAETRRREVIELIAAALTGRATRVRCVLLARARGEWWDEVSRTHGSVGDLLTGPATTVTRLGPLVPAVADRPAVVTEAARHFGDVLGTVPATVAQAFTEDDFDRVLFLHLAALEAALGDPGKAAGTLLDAALRREQALWDDGARALSLPHLAGRPMRQAAALITLAGQIAHPTEAVALLRTCPLLADQPAAVLDDVAELFHRLYPGTAWLQGVQPDLLGEHLVGRALADDPALLGVFDAVQ